MGHPSSQGAVTADHPRLWRHALSLALPPVILAAAALGPHLPVLAAAVGVRVATPHSPAVATVSALSRYRLEVRLDPQGVREPVAVSIELPDTGPERWPVEDVEVLDAEGRPLPVQRDGLEWNRLVITLPPISCTCVVQVSDAPDAQPRPPLPAEQERTVTDPHTGLTVHVCRWFDDRQAALSIRFDDSHPTHLRTVLPLLRQYGLKATFMINPGRQDYIENQVAWEACARRGDMEFANHTLHHRGAQSDEEAEREIGDVCKHIRHLFPHKSPLLALNLGGGTVWTTTRPLRYHLDKYCCFVVSGSLGMDDVYGDRIPALRDHLARHIERGLWCRVHYHSVGDGLATSTGSFREAMSVVSQHESRLWIAGMADIYKYQQTRDATRLSLAHIGTGALRLRVSCGTQRRLYDQPLTLRISLPDGSPPNRVVVTDEDATPVPLRPASGTPASGILFDVPPLDAVYTIRGISGGSLNTSADR